MVTLLDCAPIGRRLRPALCRPSIAPRRVREAVQEGVGSEGAADRFGATQRGHRLVCCRRTDQVDESSIVSVEQRRDADESVVSWVQLRADAGPAPALCEGNERCPRPSTPLCGAILRGQFPPKGYPTNFARPVRRIRRALLKKEVGRLRAGSARRSRSALSRHLDSRESPNRARLRRTLGGLLSRIRPRLRTRRSSR
jgi:hypothetical protein